MLGVSLGSISWRVHGTSWLAGLQECPVIMQHYSSHCKIMQVLYQGEGTLIRFTNFVEVKEGAGKPNEVSRSFYCSGVILVGNLHSLPCPFQWPECACASALFSYSGLQRTVYWAGLSPPPQHAAQFANASQLHVTCRATCRACAACLQIMGPIFSMGFFQGVVRHMIDESYYGE